jgi:thiamine-monophosphate kinase
MTEEQVAKIMTSNLGVNPYRKTRVYAGDSELIEHGDRKFLCTIDEFSSEDLFRSFDPETLGWNLAAASMSDILASGGKPLWYMHALTPAPCWDEEYIASLSRGIAAALEQAGAFFSAGDTSFGDKWSYTASVYGTAMEKTLSRMGIQHGDQIYISGKVGLGNFEAALSLYAEHGILSAASKLLCNRFSIRSEESAALLRFARAAIDTSDGLFSSLNTLAELNGLGYSCADIPYLKLPASLSFFFGLPKELLFFGGAGEYELLAAIPADEAAEFERYCGERDLLFTRIGEFSSVPKRELEGRDISAMPSRAREYRNPKAYLEALKKEWSHAGP